MPPKILSRLVVLYFLSAFVAVAQQIGPEFPVSDPERGPADHVQQNPSAATDGSTFLTVWTNLYGFRSELYAAQVFATGELLDRNPIPIAIPPRSGSSAQVAWTGRIFMITWQSSQPSRINVTRISRDGEILGEEELGPGQGPSLTCNGSVCLVTWISNSIFEPVFYGTLRDSDGNRTRSDFSIAPVSRPPSNVRTATNGSNFLVTWQIFDPDLIGPRESLFTAAVSGDGRVSAARRVLATSLSLGAHDVASDGSDYLLVWSRLDVKRLDSQRIRSDGVPFSEFRPLGTAALNSVHRLTRVRDGYLILGTTQNPPFRLVATFLNTDGSEADRPLISIADRYHIAAGVATAASSEKTLVVWTETGINLETDLYGAFLNPGDATLSGRLLVSESATPQRMPAMAFDGEALLVVWREERIQTGAQVYAARLDPSGVREWVRPIHPEEMDQFNPAVAFNRRDYLVVWQAPSRDGTSRSRVLARRISRGGESLEETAFVLTSSSCGDRVWVATDGHDFLVTWTECPGRQQLFASRVSADGTLLDRFPVSMETDAITSGGIAFGGEHYLVSWVDQTNLPPGGGIFCDPVPCREHTIRAARIDRAGILLDHNGVRISLQNRFGRDPRVVWDGDDFLIVWRERLLHAATFSPGGIAGAPSTFALASYRTPGPASVSWDGSAFVAVWEEGGDSSPRGSDVLLARMSRPRLDAGTATTAVPLAGSFDDERLPVVVSIAPRVVAVAYQRAAHEVGYDSANRIFIRIASFPERSRPVRC